MKKSIKKTAMALVLSSTLLFSVAGCANGSNDTNYSVKRMKNNAFQVPMCYNAVR